MSYNKYIKTTVMCIGLGGIGINNNAAAQDHKEDLQKALPISCEVIRPDVVMYGLSFHELDLTDEQQSKIQDIIGDARLEVCQIYLKAVQQEIKRMYMSLDVSSDSLNIFEGGEVLSSSQEMLSVTIKTLEKIVLVLNQKQINQLQKQLPYLEMLSQKHVEYVQYQRLRTVSYGKILSSKDPNLALFLQVLMSQSFQEIDPYYYPQSQLEKELFSLKITPEQQQKIIELLQTNYVNEYKQYQKGYSLVFKLLNALLVQDRDKKVIEMIVSQIDKRNILTSKQKIEMLSKFWGILTPEQRQSVKKKMLNIIKKN